MAWANVEINEDMEVIDAKSLAAVKKQELKAEKGWIWKRTLYGCRPLHGVTSARVPDAHNRPMKSVTSHSSHLFSGSLFRTFEGN